MTQRDSDPLLNVHIEVEHSLQGSKMPPYDDWNKIDEEEDDELQDTSVSM